MTDTTTTTHDVHVTRVFNAPVEQVWAAWREPELVKRWWAPGPFTTPVAEMDFREGGKSLVAMRSPEGHDIYSTWNYTKIEPYQRLEYVHHFADAQGNEQDPAVMGLPAGIPYASPQVVTFKALGDNQTEMTVVEYGYTTEEAAQMSRMGLEHCLDKMEMIFS